MKARIAKKKLRALAAWYHDRASVFPDWFECHFTAVFITPLDQKQARGYWGKRPTDYNTEAWSTRRWVNQVWTERMNAHISNGKLGCFKALYQLAIHALYCDKRRRQRRLLWVTTPESERPESLVVPRSMSVATITRLLNLKPEQTKGLYIWHWNTEKGGWWTWDTNTVPDRLYVHDGNLLVVDALPDPMPKSLMPLVMSRDLAADEGGGYVC